MLTTVDSMQVESVEVRFRYESGAISEVQTSEMLCSSTDNWQLAITKSEFCISFRLWLYTVYCVLCIVI